MNKARRKWLEDVIAKLEEQKEELESIQCEEQESCDNMPESLQYSERGEAIEENANDLDSYASDLQDVIDNLQEILDR
jgi:hypothetical protein